MINERRSAKTTDQHVNLSWHLNSSFNSRLLHIRSNRYVILKLDPQQPS